MRKLSFDDRYKQFRNQLRKYNLDSIVRQALRYTSTPPSDVLEDLRRAPWLAMLIAKWALLDKMVPANYGPAITPGAFKGLMQQLWSIESDLKPRTEMHGTPLLLRSCCRRPKVDHLGVRRKIWTGLCRKSKAHSVLEGTE